MKLKTIIYGMGLCLLPMACADKDNNASTQEAKVVKPQTQGGDIIKDEYIIILRDNAVKPALSYLDKSKDYKREEKVALMGKLKPKVEAEIDRWVAKHGIDPKSIRFKYTTTMAGLALKIEPKDFDRIAGSPDIEAVEHDRVATNPPITIESVSGPTQTNTRADEVTCAIKNGGGSFYHYNRNKWAYIVDSGIDLDHPDLDVVNNNTYARNFTSTNGNDYDDCYGHGSHVAGIVGAKFNGSGVVGIVADARVVPIRVLACNRSGQNSWIIAGLDHVAGVVESGEVVNLSLGGTTSTNCSGTSAYIRPLRALGGIGAFVTIAAGNNAGRSALFVEPACVSGTNIFTVASMNCNKTFYVNSGNGSNVGRPPIDWIATGVGVNSTVINGGYAVYTGTSMAAPVVAGICLRRNSAPANGGTVTHLGVSYPIAN